MMVNVNKERRVIWSSWKFVKKCGFDKFMPDFFLGQDGNKSPGIKVNSILACHESFGGLN